MKKLFSRYWLSITLILCAVLPVSAYAFDLGKTDFKGVICYVISLIKIVNPIMFVLAFILFFWGLSKFVINSSGNEKELKVGKNYMLWGILALFVLITFQALVGVLTSQFGFGNGFKGGYPFLPSDNTQVCGTTPVVDSTINFSTDPSGLPQP